MSFKYSDAGRSKSKRPRQKVDCTVRSLALTCNLSYDEAYDTLAKAGRECSKGFDIERWLRKNPAGKCYFRITKMGRKPGQAKLYRISDFLQAHPTGSFIVSTAGHVAAVIDGVMLDDVPVHYVGDRPVYGWMERWPVMDAPLWQASAVKKPIKFGGRFMVRPLGLISSFDRLNALEVATTWYKDGLRSGETVSVKSAELTP